MDFERFKQINDDRLNYREMEGASVVSSYRNLGCGDGYRIYLKFDELENITDASYTTTGCGFGLAALAIATEWVKGKSFAEAQNISVENLEAMFEFPPRRKNYPESAVEAMQKALSDFKNGTGIKPEDQVSGQYALELLENQGHLREARLTQVILENKDLSGVDFSGANLGHAYLMHASLRNSNFRGARLRGAFLNQADCENADFSGADLRWAKLSGANLEGATFKGALYDTGTRIDPKYMHIFSEMEQAGKESYLSKN
jgi:uncharacterized protein YjbI with pentapeptide repeats